MRVSNRMLQTGALEAIQSNMSGIAKARGQVASGRKLLKASDNPAAASSAMVTRSSLRSLDQYRSAIDYARQRASIEEDALNSLTDTLIRAKEVAITQAKPGTSEGTRSAARAEIDQLLRHAVSLANTGFGEGYLFAGTDPAAPPYEIVETAAGLDFTTTSPDGNHKVAISARQQIITNRNGVEVFEDTDALGVLRDLAQSLASGDPEQVRGRLDELDQAMNEVQNLIGDTGARVNRLQIAKANMDGMELNLQRYKSDLEDVEIEEAIMELAGRQTALQAAMMATSRVMGLTLAQYL